MDIASLRCALKCCRSAPRPWAAPATDACHLSAFERAWLHARRTHTLRFLGGCVSEGAMRFHFVCHSNCLSSRARARRACETSPSRGTLCFEISAEPHFRGDLQIRFKLADLLCRPQALQDYSRRRRKSLE